MTRPPIVACPHCGKESLWNTANPYRPFCCERCKMIDLGKWADEEFRVPLPPDELDMLPPDHQA